MGRRITDTPAATANSPKTSRTTSISRAPSHASTASPSSTPGALPASSGHRKRRSTRRHCPCRNTSDIVAVSSAATVAAAGIGRSPKAATSAISTRAIAKPVTACT